MNTNPREPRDVNDVIEERAIAWLCERDEGLTPERERAFRAWQDADVRHAAAIARVQRSLDLLAELPAVRAPLVARFGEVTRPAVVGPRRRGFWTPVWATGLAAALVLGGALWWRTPEGRGAVQHVATEAGAQRRLELADGSVVNVNGGSELRVQFARGERHVTLLSGEAHFEVAHDAGRPFIVNASGVSVRAVGTAFNVRVASASVEVLVVEGKVELARDSLVSTAGAAARPLLQAGEKASVARHEQAAPHVEKADVRLIREALAWHLQVVSFSDVPLHRVAAQFNLRNVFQLSIADPELAERKIGGTFALDQVEAFVRLLQQDGDVVAERRGEHEIVLRRAR